MVVYDVKRERACPTDALALDDLDTGDTAWIPMRVTSGQEERGLDDSQHGERVK